MLKHRDSAHKGTTAPACCGRFVGFYEKVIKVKADVAAVLD